VNKIDSIAGNPARLITWEFVKKTGWLPALAGGVKEGKQTWLPYVEATLLDNGVPGSAWRNCMQQHGVDIGS
jgi:hypothetical protein